VPQTFLLCLTTPERQKVAKRCNKGKKKQMFGTGLNLALALLLVQIYSGATFSTVPAKRYECPSLYQNLKKIISFVSTGAIYHFLITSAKAVFFSDFFLKV